MSQAPDANDVALTLSQVIEKLGTSLSTLHRWRQLRGFPQPAYVSSVPVWSAAAIERWRVVNLSAPRSRPIPKTQRARLRLIDGHTPAWLD